MMIDALSRKYAKAFLNVYADAVTLQDVERVAKICVSLNQHRGLLSFFSWPVINDASKIQALKDMVTQYGLPRVLHRLIELLSEHKRLELVLQVFQAIVVEYKKRHNIASVTIASSHEMQPEDLEIVKQFLAKLTGQVIMYTYKVDKSLIAGMRVASDTFVWEHSIGKQLALMKLPLIR